MDRFRPVRRKQRYGTHDQDDVLVRAPLFVERPDEALVLLVHVSLGQLQDVRPQVGHLLLAVGDLEKNDKSLTVDKIFINIDFHENIVCEKLF